MIKNKSNSRISNKFDSIMLAKSIVFSTLALIGFGIIVISVFSEISLSFLTTLYLILVYIAYVEFFQE